MKFILNSLRTPREPSMVKPFNVSIYIGRFQPLHDAHVETIKQAFTFSERVFIFIGSSFKPRTYKNPFTEDERFDMISQSLSSLGLKYCINYNIFMIPDHIHDDQKWLNQINEIVNCFTNANDNIAIIGHKKDQTSYYLEKFPKYELVEMPLWQNLNSQDIRELYFKNNLNFNFIHNVIPLEVHTFLQEFSKTEDFDKIIRERTYEENYKKPFSTLPYPPIFVTADAVVFHDSIDRKVLLIERDTEPGKGLLALPGGFVDANGDSSIQDAMFRELKEETELELEPKHIINSRVFDKIGRSSRGRVIAHAYALSISSKTLPKVRGSSDARRASWYSLSDLNSKYFFEDHYEIISTFGDLC